MGAGQLRDRVTFQKEIRTPDGGGGSTKSWGDDLTVWGQFNPERGRERLAAGRLESALGGVLKIRSSIAARALTTSHRVTIDGDRFQIRSIANPDRRNRFLEMVVEKNVAL